MTGPIEILGANRRALVSAASDVGVKRLKLILARAQGDLNRRLRQAQGLGGAGADSFTAHQLQVSLIQVQHVIAHLNKGLKALVVAQAKGTADPSVEGVIRYLHAAEKRFSGITERLPIKDAILFDRARSGAESSALHRLEGDPKKGPGILKRYGDAVIEKFEGHLQQRLLARAPWADVRNQLIADSPFLQQAPAHWAERIVRTESMNGSNRAIWEANKGADEQLGDVVKILSATFDDRTGADSVAVHGQIRRPNEAFEWWDGLYQHPPNRPNDREVVVTHRIAWPIPPELAFRSDAEVHARWVANGRLGAPPGRPKMTTVDLATFGAAPPPEPEQPPARPIMEPPAVPTREKRGPIASPFFDENVEPWKSAPEPEPTPASLANEAPLELVPADYFAQAEGGQKGSNEGGFYRGSDGVLRYAKFYKDPTQGALEHLANNIYRDLGLPAVKSDLVIAPDGRQAYVSEVVEGDTLAKKGLDAKNAKQVLKGFAADVLVKNWDAVGLDHDNVIIGKGGKAVRIDNGGAFLHRAKHGMKPESSLKEIDEWEQFLNPAKNPAYAKLAAKAGVTKAEDIVGIQAQIKAIQKLRVAHGGWGGYVDHVSPNLPPDVRTKVVGMLAERSVQLGQKLNAMKGKAKQPKPVPGARDFTKLASGKLPGERWKPEGVHDVGEYHAAQDRKIVAIYEKVPGFREALRDYTGGAYGPIRQAGIKTYEEFSAWYAEGHYGTVPSQASYLGWRKQCEVLNKGFDLAEQAQSGALAEKPESGVKELFRGLGDISKDRFDELVGLKDFEIESVTSTSWNPAVAKNFMRSSAGKFKAMLHFKMKNNATNKLSIETRSGYGVSEREVLMRRGLKFKVANVKRVDPNTVILELEED